MLCLAGLTGCFPRRALPHMSSSFLPLITFLQPDPYYPITSTSITHCCGPQQIMMETLMEPGDLEEVEAPESTCQSPRNCPSKTKACYLNLQVCLAFRGENRNCIVVLRSLLPKEINQDECSASIFTLLNSLKAAQNKIKKQQQKQISSSRTHT